MRNLLFATPMIVAGIFFIASVISNAKASAETAGNKAVQAIVAAK